MLDEAKKKKKEEEEKEKSSASVQKYINVKPVLDEAAKGTVVASWGRMNPVTSGHEKLALKVASEAKSRKATPAIYLSHSSDPKKNPLSYNDKVKFAQAAFGNIVVKSSAKTIIEVAKELSQTYKNLVLVVGSDRVGEFERLLSKYNGKDYKFDSIEIVSAGDRDPDADDVSGMSASKMRALAQEGDMKSFKKGLPKKLQRNAQQVYDAVRAGMGIDESLEEELTLDEVMSRAQRKKRAIVMKKFGKKIARARARSMKKKASKEKLVGRAEKQVKQALKDKFSKGKNYADLSISQKQAVEKRIKKISGAKIKNLVKKKLPDVRKKEQERLSKKIDVKDESKTYYKGVAQDKKDDREAHFKRKSKVNDNDPKAYTDAPGDKEAREKGTKTSKHTKKFKDMFGEVTEASKRDMMPKKRPHMLMASKGGVKFDNRFKVYKAWKKKWDEFEKQQLAAVKEDIGVMEEVLDLAESVEFIFESNPKKALQKKAEKTGIAYSILKKVFDRGVAAWRTGHRPGTTPAQWGLARVNSFATGGKTRTTADADLWAKHKG